MSADSERYSVPGTSLFNFTAWSAQELNGWFHHPLSVMPFSRVHERVTQLVGRDVWTHEMASSNTERLIEEARNWNHPENLNAHAVESLADMVGAENVYVYPAASQEEETQP